MNQNLLTTIQQYLVAGGSLWLFLDYDGTLVPIARTPSEARPDAELLVLLASLARYPQFRLTILSGRPLVSLREMLPVPGLILAGTYGLEIQYPSGLAVLRAEFAQLRPTIERVRTSWTVLLAVRDGFLLEDKGLALALHARHADPLDALVVLPLARVAAKDILDPAQFRLLGGDRFLEVAPQAANKGNSVVWLLGEESAFWGLLVYLGDDDKDEDAFAVVRQRGGIPIMVGIHHSSTQALARFPSTDSVREWLRMLLEAVMPSHSPPAALGRLP
ncbi:MAG: trehalose-phosphatase [Acidobacteriota bacterium]